MRNLTFTALDFETAQPDRKSICQVGLIIIENGETTEEHNFLIQPPGNFYWKRFTQIHGIQAPDTLHAPTFDQVWPVIRRHIENKIVVAHNAPFDMSCLHAALEHYGLEQPIFEPQCTYRIYRAGLATLCTRYAIPLQHHDALSDARACAQLYLKHLMHDNDTHSDRT